MLISPKWLKAKGILGINRRNLSYINRYNQRCFYPLVDNKLKTKLLAIENDVSTPNLLHVVRGQQEIKRVVSTLETLPSFVLKPAKGSGGKGILVIHHQQDGQFVKPSGAMLNRNELERHMSNILAGLYSLSGQADTILIEEMVTCHSSLREYSHEGVPDIRVIVFKGFPVMAMIRLATHASDGKANLHQGAVGVGIDIATGAALNAVQFSRNILTHPDNGKPFNAIKIDNWSNILTLAASCYEMTQLGYIGADIVIDQSKGAQLLELNARPGLAIQLANGIGLLPRLKTIENTKRRYMPPEQRTAMAQQLFGTNSPKAVNQLA